MSRYPSKIVNIPFYDPKGDVYRVKMKRARRDIDDLAAPTRLFIRSFFPEFYAFTKDVEAFEIFENADMNVANQLQAEILSRTSRAATLQTRPPTNKRLVIYTLAYDIDKKRQELEAAEQLPSFEDNLNFFNVTNDIGEITAESTFVVSTLGKTNNSLNDGLRSFNTQLQGFEGQIDLNIDFSTVRGGTQQILNLLATMLSSQAKTSTPNYKFAEADTITVYFAQQNGKIAIGGMEYLLIEDSIEPQPLKIGYFPLIEYNRFFQDPLTLATLKNYQSILSSVQSSDASNSNFSFLDFLQDPSVAAELGAPPASILDFQPQPKKDAQNILIGIASEFGLIDVGDTQSLEKGFTTALTSQELERLRNDVANNPEVYTRVYANQKAKKLNTGINVTKAIGNILERGPMGFVEGDSAVARIFRQVGIDELAKEAFLCLTFGVNFEAGRLNTAVQNALVRTSLATAPATSRDGAEPYQPPQQPKAAPISKPVIDPKMFKPFTISGDIWKEVLKSVINSLQEAALDAIKDVAELLKENCDFNNPRSSDYGATDINDLLNTDEESNLLPSVGTGTQLDSISSKNGMSVEELMLYLGALSGILSSIEVCILFQNREDASSELIDRILEFNAEYSNIKVREGMSTVTSIMGFFADLSATVDVTELCNSIINDLYLLNQDDICLTADDLSTSDMEKLLDLIENGLRLAPAPPNLECPEAEGFLNDPTITISVPETFNSLAETVELQFIASADSVKEVLLEQVFTTGDDSGVLANAKEAGAESTGSLENFDSSFLKPLIGVLESLASFDVQACDPDTVSTILGPDAMAALGGIQTGLDVTAQTVSDPNFQQAIEGLVLKLQGIADAGGATPTPMYPSYRFNQQFLNEFVNYIDMSQASYEFPSLEVPLYYEAFRESAGPSSLTQYGTQNIVYRFPDTVALPIEAPPLASGLLGEFFEMSKLDAAPVCSHDRTVGDVLYFLMTATQQQYSAYDPQTLATPQEPFAVAYPDIAEWVQDRYGEIATVPLTTLTPLAYGALVEYLQTYTPSQDRADLYGASSGQDIIPSSPSWPSAGYVGNQEWMQKWLQLIYVVSGVMDSLNVDRSCRDPILDQALLELNALGLPATTGEFTTQALQTKLFLDTIYEVEATDLLEGNLLSIAYPRDTGLFKVNQGNSPNMVIKYQSTGDYIPPANITETLLVDEEQFRFENDETSQNAYTKVFVDAFEDPSSPLEMSTRVRIENRHFAYAYAILTDGVFDYVRRNGVFSAATLQSLNFFHLNTNCPPDEVSDLLDVNGILAQMQKEFIESACNDTDLPLRKKIRNMIKFGMYLLLVQVAIAEFIVKNIFVFSAFKIDELIETPFIKVFMRQQIVASMLRYLANEDQNKEALVRSDLVEYFNLKIRRNSVQENGGIKFEDGSTAFPADIQFSVVDDGGFAGFDEIIDFLISERLVLGKIPVNNAVKNSFPESNPQSMDSVFLRSIEAFKITAGDSAAHILESINVSETRQFNTSDLVFMTVKETAMSEAGTNVEPPYTELRHIVNAPPKPFDLSGLPIYERFSSETLPYDGQGPSVKTTDENNIVIYRIALRADDELDEYAVAQQATQALQSGDYQPFDDSPEIPAALAYNVVPKFIMTSDTAAAAEGSTGESDITMVSLNDSDWVGFDVYSTTDASIPDPPEVLTGKISRAYKLWYYRNTGSSEKVYLLRDFGAKIFDPSLDGVAAAPRALGLYKTSNQSSEDDQSPSTTTMGRL